MTLKELLEKDLGVDGWKIKLEISDPSFDVVYQNTVEDQEELKRSSYTHVHLTGVTINYNFKERIIGIYAETDSDLQAIKLYRFLMIHEQDWKPVLTEKYTSYTTKKAAIENRTRLEDRYAVKVIQIDELIGDKRFYTYDSAFKRVWPEHVNRADKED